jgi:endonuclease/exonuclease/phosphatase family metal-dependent hydrolase
MLTAACTSGNDKATTPASAGPTTTRATGADDLTVVSMNVLHGASCADGNHCQAPDRVALLARLIERARCPDVVALQEIAAWMYDLVQAQARTICSGAYRTAFGPEQSVDRELVLTRLPVVESEHIRLAGPQRTALRVRLRSRLGMVDLVDTHTGNGADNEGRGGLPCTAEACPPPCDPTGFMLTCQIRQVADLLESHRAPGSTGLIVGDLNVVAGSVPYKVLPDRGFADTHLAAGGQECDAATGTNCTSGKVDYMLDELRNPASKESERVDFIFLSPSRACPPRYDTGRDADGDGVPTGFFGDRPVTDGPGGLAFPSDHVGTALDLACR